MKLQLSTTAIIIVLAACFIIDLDLKNWTKQDRVIEWDVHSYYAYLPATFIYDDIHLTKSEYKFGEHYYLFWSTKTEDGKNVIKTSMGTALLYAPFFFVAHAYTLLSDYPPNGFSEPYKVFLLLSAIFYLLIGLDFLKKTLRHFNFPEATTAIVILLIGLGTNLLCYSSQTAPWSHVYSFCLISIFIFYTIKWYELSSAKHTIILGLLIGLISLIRPSNVLILIYFVFYGVSNPAELKQRIIVFRKRFLFLTVMFLFAFVVWVPQFVYWKIVTGSYLFYSYTDERFFFNNPQIINGLFSFRKGWLVYTPVMVFALAGIFLMKDSLKKLRLPILLFVILNLYVTFSWWVWWYGGSFGQRSLIDSYALLAIPFASFIQYVSEKKWYYTITFYGIGLFFIWLNIFQMYQFEHHSLHWDSMTKELYFKQFGKLDKIKDFDDYLNYANYEEAKIGGKKMNADGNNLKQTAAVPQGVKNEKRISLKAANEKFVWADKKKNSLVVATSDNGWEWETFSLIMFENNKCAIRTYDNHFFSAEITNLNEIAATHTVASDWETFTLVDLEDNFVAFKAVNGKYLSLDEKTLQIFAKGESIGVNEKFKLIQP